MSETNPLLNSYPFVELIVGFGIFLVYFVEEFIGLFNGGHSHSTNSSQKIHILNDENEKRRDSFKSFPTPPLPPSVLGITHGHCCHTHNIS